jgi:type IV secretory pathway TrbL component
MLDKRIIFSGAAIVATLATAFLSQQAFMKVNGTTFVSAAMNQAKASITKGSDWVMSKVSDNVQSGGEAIKKTAANTTKNVSNSLGNKIENYFSNLGNSIIGKTPEPASCSAQLTK